MKVFIEFKRVGYIEDWVFFLIKESDYENKVVILKSYIVFV